VVGTAVGEGESDGDGDWDGDGDSVSGVSDRSAGVATTPIFDVGGAGDFDGAGPTIAPSAPRPPQQNTSVEVIPTPTTDTICCGFDIRAKTCANPTMRSFHERSDRYPGVCQLP
jgi:hypothetical protein